MAAEKYAYGIKSVKFGTPTGSNTMPGSLTAFAQTVAGSFTLSEDEAQTKDFKVEEVTTPVKTTVTDVGALSATWRCYNISPAILAMVKGGTATTPAAPTAHTYDGPVSVATKDLALEITTTDNVVFAVYKAAVLARFDGSMGRENILELEVRAIAQDPGNGESPYKITFPNPA